jgi:hypothetical protein
MSTATATVTTPSPPFSIHWNAAGRLVLTTADGIAHVGVVPVRAFPVSAADEGLSVVDGDGHELVWINRLDELPTAMQDALRRGLQEREFMPIISRLCAVSSYATPSTWTVETDRGRFDLILKGEENLLRLGSGALLVVDSHGVQYLIRDVLSLDRHSKKLLDRFL